MLSKFPVDSTRLLRVDSTYRNRINFPNPADFDIVLPNEQQYQKGKYALDPVYNSYPTEFGFFGNCVSNTEDFTVLQLSEQSSNSSNYYNGKIIVDETVCPRTYTNCLFYDATPDSFGYSKACIIDGFTNDLQSGNPGSLFSVRNTMPLFQGSGYSISPRQFLMTNTGIYGVNITQVGSR